MLRRRYGLYLLSGGLLILDAPESPFGRIGTRFTVVDSIAQELVRFPTDMFLMFLKGTTVYLLLSQDVPVGYGLGRWYDSRMIWDWIG